MRISERFVGISSAQSSLEEIQCCNDQGHDRVRYHHKDDAGDDRGGGIALALKPAHASGHGDENTEDRAFANAELEVDEPKTVGDLGEVFVRRDIE